MEQGQVTIKQENKKYNYNIFISLIYSLTVIIIGFTGFMNDQPLADILKFILLMIIIITILFNVMKLYQIELLQDNLNLIVFCSGYFISLIGIMLSTNYEVYNLWMIGSAFIAVLIYPYFGLTFHFIFTFLFSAVNNPGMEYFAFYFIIGAIICMLAEHIVNPKTIIYVILITLSINVTLIFILHNFNFATSMDGNAFYSVLSTLAVIGVTFFANKLIRKESSKVPLQNRQDTLEIQATELVQASEKAHTTETLSIGKEVQPVVEKVESSGIAKLDEVMNGEYELLKRLSNHSKNLYIHSVDVGEMSARAAKLVNGKEEIARAGGLYHEIGRINGKNYIEEGVMLATEQRFPQAVIDIIKQHNSKFEKPRSAEAAIVMLTDSILSTMEYIASMPNKKEIAPEDLVDNIFQIRLSKGTLDESGITAGELKILKEFYIKNCF